MHLPTSEANQVLNITFIREDRAMVDVILSIDGEQYMHRMMTRENGRAAFNHMSQFMAGKLFVMDVYSTSEHTYVTEMQCERRDMVNAA